MTQPDGSNGKKVTARVAVVAAGVVSPLGFGLTETLESLCNSRDCVSPVIRFSVEQCRCKTAGQIPDDRLLASRGDVPRSRRLHRASHMMIEALKEVVTQAPQFKPELTVIGTTSGGMSYGEDYYRSLHQGRRLRCAPKAPQFLRWKTSTSLANEVRLFWQKLSATAFLRIIFTSPSPILRASGRSRRWSELSKARTFQRTQSIT